MKKLLITLIGLTAIAASAQVHQSQNLLVNCQAVYVTNNITVTNLQFPGLTITTNFAGLTFTNLSGVRVVVTNSSSGSLLNFAGIASLWTDRNGNPVGVGGYWYTNQSISAMTPVFSAVSVQMTGQSGASDAVRFTFAPVYESNTGGTTPRIESASTGLTPEWTFGLTPTTSLQNLTTNVPTYLWPGAKGLVLKRIVNADVDADSAVIVTRIKLNGFVP